MLAQKLDKKKLLQLIGVDHQRVGALAREAKATKWTLVTIAKAPPPPDSGRFFRSLKDHVDSADKKSSYLTMVAELCSAIEDDDYQAALKIGSVSVKVAHNFTFGGHKHAVWELKYGKKDRIYFYPHTPQRLIFILMAYHKKDQQTPDDVCKACEKDIKQILDPKCAIDFC
ncbi:hypothetical protein KDW23_03695 [Burkholderia cenocepacia]|uniref:hypothetical protein n=1 Tax=Burkholderia cenocepacia TaxID=95486 RepID=UPI001BA094E5|nr:hypothetical protein [Burkholderia cenocepacia]MBR8070065.1 hypothetical protein [Burkholderia cenocepacia]MBR8443795.1 hypothetical protein [Burkholderia cenocepacia]